MRNIIILIAILLLATTITSAQILPPPNHTQTCDAIPLMYFYFGPNCLNPIYWDLDGFYPIDTWVNFTYNDTQGIGQIRGYSWQWYEGRYHYWITTQQFYNYEFLNVPPENITPIN